MFVAMLNTFPHGLFCIAGRVAVEHPPKRSSLVFSSIAIQYLGVPSVCHQYYQF
jgi:hypothetical protein